MSSDSSSGPAAATRPPGLVCSIASARFPHVFLRLDGQQVKAHTKGGAGVANAQFGDETWERFRLARQDDGTFTIESVRFPGVFLRLDGREVKHYTTSGSGTVNGQSGAGEWERFRLERKPDLTFTIESVAFPGVFLRLCGKDMTQYTSTGGGMANAQLGAFSWERFRLLPQLESL